MSRKFVQNTVLPAILASSAVFSFLTLPFFFYRTQIEVVNEETSLQQQLQPIVMNENRDLTIRYIGGAMVVSVLTGGAVVELGRRRLRQAEAAQHFGPEASADWTEPVLATDDRLEWEDLEHSAAWSAQSISSPDRRVAYPDPDLADSSAVEEAADGSAEPSVALVELPESYPTCRIRLPHSQSRLFAIQLAGQYYSFFRLLASQEEAQQFANQFSDQQRLIITPIEQQFALWIWQPAAELELVSV